MILSGSTTVTFKDQELFTADSWEQFALSTFMPTSAKLRLVLLVVAINASFQFIKLHKVHSKLTHLGYVRKRSEDKKKKVKSTRKFC